MSPNSDPSAEKDLQQATASTGPMPNIKLPPYRTRLDFATIIGLTAAIALIIGAIMMSESDASFINAPALMIVFFGTIAATSVSYTTNELRWAWGTIAKTVAWRYIDIQKFAKSLITIATISRQKGVLALSHYEQEFKNHPDLDNAMQMVIDGTPPESIELTLTHEIETARDTQKRSASICRRASEIAPAMGLIGTLVGLVQMLADLQNPESIGPAMAVALLTTFYGAILGTIVMGPLAVKLEKHTIDTVLRKTLIKNAALSITRKDNPRRLETLLNSELHPAKQIKYFN